MAFGQSSGPPATGKQLSELLALLEAAGHSGFRDARGPMGFNQRQATGKFTRDEAQAFIDQLEEAAYSLELASLPPRSTVRQTSAAPIRPASFRATPAILLTAGERAVRAVSDAELLAEVRRRGLSEQL